MHLTIDKVILWPIHEAPPRIVAFKANKLNLVTGRSRTGKSSLTYIIDYVLGSSKCAIPVGPIRTRVEWYGLLLDLGSSKMLVGREEPKDRRESSNYFVLEGPEIAIPSKPTKNSNRDAFKERMNQLAGLPSTPLGDDELASSFQSRPGFRDMVAFNFLPQHIVANPYTLFYRTETTEHRTRLRNIFPLALGELTPQHLVATQARAELQRQLDAMLRQLNRLQRAAEAWSGEVFGLHARAVELGLLIDVPMVPASVAECVDHLRRVPASLGDDGRLETLGSARTDDMAIHISELQDREAELDASLMILKQRLVRVERLSRSAATFGEVSARYADRVHGAGWFRKKIGGESPCPVCGTSHASAHQVLDTIEAAAKELEHRQRVIQSAPQSLQRERATIAKDIRETEEKLGIVRTERVELERLNESTSHRLDQVYRFIGRLEQALDNLAASEADGGLAGDIASLRARIETLDSILDPTEQRNRREASLRAVAREIEHYARFLELERQNDSVGLDTKELSLVFQSVGSGRKDYLWEIGSGENWMGYHLATMLALHRLFLRSKLPYVPTFLIIDQPSQVYFPTGWPVAGASDSHEIKATRRIFEALEEGLRRTNYSLQIIITEHADESTLGGIASLHVAEDWHGEDVDYLIPRAWLATSLDET